MKRKDIQKLFPQSQPEAPRQAQNIPANTVIWSRAVDFEFTRTYLATGFSTTVEIRHDVQDFFSITDFGRLDLGGVSRVRIHCGAGVLGGILGEKTPMDLPLSFGDYWLSLEPEDGSDAVIRRNSQGVGLLRLKGGKTLRLGVKKSRTCLWDEALMVAELIPAWRDADVEQGIFCRTWTHPDYPEIDAIRISALLVLAEFGTNRNRH